MNSIQRDTIMKFAKHFNARFRFSGTAILFVFFIVAAHSNTANAVRRGIITLASEVCTAARIASRHASTGRQNNMDMINKLVAQKLVAEQFPKWAHHEVVPVENGGWDHRTFHLGKDMVLRFPSAASYANQVQKEQKWLPYLAPRLPLTIPTPVGLGNPGHGYPWHWSVYNWIDGDTVASQTQLPRKRIASPLAQFLTTLYSVDTKDGPLAGEHNYYRGGHVSHYEEEVFKAIELLGTKVDAKTITRIWKSGAESEWEKPPVWVHGDVSPGNLLIKDEKLSAVIDFGLLSVGDPACDLAISWTYFEEESRKCFREALEIDTDTWKRGRSWALWKSLILTSGMSSSNPVEVALAGHVIREALNDFRKNG